MEWLIAAGILAPVLIQRFGPTAISTANQVITRYAPALNSYGPILSRYTPNLNTIYNYTNGVSQSLVANVLWQYGNPTNDASKTNIYNSYGIYGSNIDALLENYNVNMNALLEAQAQIQAGLEAIGKSSGSGLSYYRN